MNQTPPDNSENKPQEKKKRSGGIDKLVMSLIIGAAVGSVVGISVKEQKKRGFFSSLKGFLSKKPTTSKAVEKSEPSMKKIPDESK